MTTQMTNTNNKNNIENRLRDRIATALGGELHVNLLGNGYDVEDLIALATHLIKEINLLPEYSEGDDDCRWTWNNMEEMPTTISPTEIQTRYVTPWEFCSVNIDIPLPPEDDHFQNENKQ